MGSETRFYVENWAIFHPFCPQTRKKGSAPPGAQAQVQIWVSIVAPVEILGFSLRDKPTDQYMIH